MRLLLDLYQRATHTHVRAIGFLSTLALACFLSGFFSLPPIDRDEARFVQATKQMIETGDYIDIRNQDQVRYKKPVGIHWLQAAAVAGSGQGADAPIWIYRIPSALGALAVVLLTYWTGLALVGSQAAALAAAMMAASLLLGVEARLAKTDAVLVASIVAAMGVLARLYMDRDKVHGPSLAVLFWIAGAVGILIKGPIWVMIIGLAVAAQSIADRSLSWLRPLSPLIGIPALLAMTLPWFIAIMVISDGAFLKASLGNDALGKVASAQQSHGAPPGTYLGAFLITGWPLIAPVLLALGAVWRSRRTPEMRFLLCWILPSWLVFELIVTKLPHYVLPLYPALALIAAAAMRRGDLAHGRWWTRLIAVLGVVALIYGPPIALALRWMLEGVLPVAGLLAWLLIVPLGVYAVRWAWQDRLRDAVVLAVLAAPLFYVSIYEGALARMDTWQVSSRLADTIAGNIACDTVEVMSTGYREMSLVFLVGTDTAWGSLNEAAAFVGERPCRVAIILDGEKQAFEDLVGRAGHQVSLAGQVDGFNLGNSKPVSLLVYTAGAQ